MSMYGGIRVYFSFLHNNEDTISKSAPADYLPVLLAGIVLNVFLSQSLRRQMDCMTGLDSDSFCSLLIAFVKRQNSDVPYSAIFGDVTLAFS